MLSPITTRDTTGQYWFDLENGRFAAPMAMDLSRWAAALKLAGVAGAVPDLGFYFKRPVGENAPVDFELQRMTPSASCSP